MEPYDRLHEDVDVLVAFLEQVDQFTFLYEELLTVDTRIDDQEERAAYQNALRAEMKTLYDHGIGAMYDDATMASRRLHRFIQELENETETTELEGFEQYDDPEQVYQSLRDLVVTFQSVEAENIGARG